MIEQPARADMTAYMRDYRARQKARAVQGIHEDPAAPEREPRPCTRCAAYAEEVAHLKRLLAQREPVAHPVPKVSRGGFGFNGGGVREDM